MFEDSETPFPEIDAQNADKSIREQFQELEAREAREKEQAQDAKIQAIEKSGDISELLADNKLRFAYVEKFGPVRFGQLHAQHLRGEKEKRLAEDAAKRAARPKVSTSYGRILAANGARRQVAK